MSGPMASASRRQRLGNETNLEEADEKHTYMIVTIEVENSARGRLWKERDRKVRKVR